jgi:hypothetical protein
MSCTGGESTGAGTTHDQPTNQRTTRRAMSVGFTFGLVPVLLRRGADLERRALPLVAAGPRVLLGPGNKSVSRVRPGHMPAWPRGVRPGDRELGFACSLACLCGGRAAAGRHHRPTPHRPAAMGALLPLVALPHCLTPRS